MATSSSLARKRGFPLVYNNHLPLLILIVGEDDDDVRPVGGLGRWDARADQTQPEYESQRAVHGCSSGRRHRRRGDTTTQVISPPFTAGETHQTRRKRGG